MKLTCRALSLACGHNIAFWLCLFLPDRPSLADGIRLAFMQVSTSSSAVFFLLGPLQAAPPLF